MTRILPAKDRSIAGATFDGAGREVEYRIEGNPGLVLAVMAPGKDGRSSKVWRAYYSLTTEARRTIRKVKIGAYPHVGLAEARRKAAEVVEAVEHGRDPVGDKHVRKTLDARDALTFADLIADHIADIATRRSPKHVQEIRKALMSRDLDALRVRKPSDITPLDIQMIVDVVHARGAEAMARHLLVYLRSIFNSATKKNMVLRDKYGIVANPADPVGRDDRYGRQEVAERSLSDSEVVAFWRTLDCSGIDERTQIILKLLLLTGQRPSEVRCAETCELRFKEIRPYWDLPKVDRNAKPPRRRTKNGLPHEVPLPPLASKLFRRALDIGGGSPFVFPSNKTNDGILGEYTLRQAVERLFENGALGGKSFSPKSLRATVKTGLAVLGIPQEIRDRVQNHKPVGVGDRVYNKHDYFNEKLDALTRWADHVERLVSSSSESARRPTGPTRQI